MQLTANMLAGKDISPAANMLAASIEEPMKKVIRRKSDRRNLPVSDETHKHLQVLAALDRSTMQDAFDKYAAPAVAKAFEAKTAPSK